MQMQGQTESAVKIQDELEDISATILTSQDDITINAIVAVNADGSSINTANE